MEKVSMFDLSKRGARILKENLMQQLTLNEQYKKYCRETCIHDDLERSELTTGCPYKSSAIYCKEKNCNKKHTLEDADRDRRRKNGYRDEDLGILY